MLDAEFVTVSLPDQNAIKALHIGRVRIGYQKRVGRRIVGDEQLRQFAAQKLSHEKPGQTLQATALVHEAWLRLVRDEEWSWNDSSQFFYAAADLLTLRG